MSVRSLRISHVGVRGIVGPGLQASHALDFGAAFGTLLAPGAPVILGRDPRASGLMLHQSVIAALLACGHDCLDLGIVSTPVVQHAIQRLKAAGGISIGASHNAAEWNALKFFGRDGVYLSTGEATELLDIYHLRKFRYAGYQGLGHLTDDATATDRYIDDLAQAFDFDSLRRFRVVVDCCNGTSALILRRMQERYGFGFILINESLEGKRFAHEPATNARTVALQLAPLIAPLTADAGFLFDADSDRVALATEQGDAISEEMILPLVMDHRLPKERGRIVITNLSTTALVEEVAARHGGTVVRVPVGRQATIDALGSYRPGQVAMAGEGTGAIMFSRFPFIYDGIVSMLTILEMMRERREPLSRIIAGFPRYSMLKGEVPLASTQIPALLTSIEQAHPEGRVNRIDGLRIDLGQEWFHVRVAQTEPIVRVICERKGEAPRALFDSLMEQVLSLT